MGSLRDEPLEAPGLETGQADGPRAHPIPDVPAHCPLPLQQAGAGLWVLGQGQIPEQSLLGREGGGPPGCRMHLLKPPHGRARLPARRHRPPEGRPHPSPLQPGPVSGVSQNPDVPGQVELSGLASSALPICASPGSLHADSALEEAGSPHGLP